MRTCAFSYGEPVCCVSYSSRIPACLVGVTQVVAPLVDATMFGAALDLVGVALVAIGGGAMVVQLWLLWLVWLWFIIV